MFVCVFVGIIFVKIGLFIFIDMYLGLIVFWKLWLYVVNCLIVYRILKNVVILDKFELVWLWLE